MREVSIEEFYSFIREYPNPLEKNTVFFSEPPVTSYHDFTLGKAIQSIVCNHTYEDRDGNKAYIPSNFRIYDKEKS